MIGLIGKKVGMSQMFDSDDDLIPVTLIKIETNHVLEVKSQKQNGYSALVLASIPARESRVAKPVAGQFRKDVEIPLQQKIAEFRMDDVPSIEHKRGDQLTVAQLRDCGFVDVTGTTKGKGFQGVMRRHGFSGGRKTHGSKTHREVGSTGMAATPSRTLKNTKMAGRMPARQVTVQNLRIINIDEDQGLLAVQGAVPGPMGKTLMVRNARKRGIL